MKKRYTVISTILVLLFIIFATHTLWLEAIAKFLVVGDGDISRADAIVILGSGGPERVERGVELYKSGYGAKIIITGEELNLPGFRINWSQLAMREAVASGVPQKAIILEERPSSTYEDAVYVKEDMLSGNFKSAIVVSSNYHTRRAKVIFKKVFRDQKDISLQFSPADYKYFQTREWWTREKELVTVVNEYCKLIFYFFKYII